MTFSTRKFIAELTLDLLKGVQRDWRDTGGFSPRLAHTSYLPDGKRIRIEPGVEGVRWGGMASTKLLRTLPDRYWQSVDGGHVKRMDLHAYWTFCVGIQERLESLFVPHGIYPLLEIAPRNVPRGSRSENFHLYFYCCSFDERGQAVFNDQDPKPVVKQAIAALDQEIKCWRDDPDETIRLGERVYERFVTSLRRGTHEDSLYNRLRKDAAPVSR